MDNHLSIENIRSILVAEFSLKNNSDETKEILDPKSDHPIGVIKLYNKFGDLPIDQSDVVSLA